MHLALQFSSVNRQNFYNFHFFARDRIENKILIFVSRMSNSFIMPISIWKYFSENFQMEIFTEFLGKSTFPIFNIFYVLLHYNQTYFLNPFLLNIYTRLKFTWESFTNKVHSSVDSRDKRDVFIMYIDAIIKQMAALYYL